MMSESFYLSVIMICGFVVGFVIGFSTAKALAILSDEDVLSCNDTICVKKINKDIAQNEEGQKVTVHHHHSIIRQQSQQEEERQK